MTSPSTSTFPGTHAPPTARHIRIIDSTLRDGSHAMRHQFTAEHITQYAAAAEAARMPMVVVGHGNGLGASSIQLGRSLVSDSDMVRLAKAELERTQLAVFLIPGFGTIRSDLEPIADLVDAVFIACHCSEADVTQTHIKWCKSHGKEALGVLMMTHMLEPEQLLGQALKMQSYGADAVLLMDSAGALLMGGVRSRVSALAKGLKIPVGFHAHNNLGLAVGNSLTAVEAGATILDCTVRGLGAGAGNAPLEVVVAALSKEGYETGIDLYAAMDLSEDTVTAIRLKPQEISRISLASGLAGVFSGFCPLAVQAGERFGVDPRDILMELGRRRIVAGQEDFIIDIAAELAKKKKGNGARKQKS